MRKHCQGKMADRRKERLFAIASKRFYLSQALIPSPSLAGAVQGGAADFLAGRN